MGIQEKYTYQEVSKKNNDCGFANRRDIDGCFFFDFWAKVLREMMNK